MENSLHRLESNTGKQFGGAERQLLVSVRSGAAVSMPGMMETILNLGLNYTTVEGLTRQSDVAASAQRLQAVTPEQWADYATFSARLVGEPPRNAEEDKLFSSRHRFREVPAGSSQTTDLETEIGHHLRILTQNPDAPKAFVNLRRQVQRD